MEQYFSMPSLASLTTTVVGLTALVVAGFSVRPHWGVVLLFFSPTHIPLSFKHFAKVRGFVAMISLGLTLLPLCSAQKPLDLGPSKAQEYVVDRLDLGAFLPTISLTANKYEDCGTAGLLVFQAVEVSANDVEGKLAGETVGSVLRLTWIDHFWNSLQERVVHDIVDRYQNRIKERCDAASSA